MSFNSATANLNGRFFRIVFLLFPLTEPENTANYYIRLNRTRENELFHPTGNMACCFMALKSIFNIYFNQNINLLYLMEDSHITQISISEWCKISKNLL